MSVDIHDRIKIGERYNAAIDVSDLETGQTVDMTGWSARLTLQTSPQIIYTTSDNITIAPGDVHNQVQINIPTATTSLLAEGDIEADLDLVDASGETEISLLIKYRVVRRAE